MTGFRLSRLALPALLLRSSFSATEITPDDDEAGLVTMAEEALVASPPPEGGLASSGQSIGADVDSDPSIWGSGKFVLQRSQVVVPPGEAHAYWFCSGGLDRINASIRMHLASASVPRRDFGYEQ